MIRRPPRSPLFPYPPLSRSEPQLLRQPAHGLGFSVPSLRRGERVERHVDDDLRALLQVAGAHRHLARQPLLQLPPVRSEEHTSELQSPCNLVCRLLLEKKKN